ncbi:hypothetical protein BH24ACT6_BH24ACT6_03770 [soil metagenome]
MVLLVLVIGVSGSGRRVSSRQSQPVGETFGETQLGLVSRFFLHKRHNVTNLTKQLRRQATPSPFQRVDGEHMTPDEFRRLGHDYVDWVASYWERVGDLPVQSPLAPATCWPACPTPRPSPATAWKGCSSTSTVPGLTHWQHPSFFAFFPANTSGPGVLADIISSGLGVNGMNWATSPACTESR